jgi:tRNA dimethylallyltransferase
VSEAPSAVLCLAGPTASGKTAAALALAEHWPVEIVSVDSALVYRGMDIGTAKPSADERRRVPHHLIDIRDPWQPYSAADFAADARRLIDDIRGRGRLPLLVGGTMLYLKALADGLDAMPAADPAVRAELDAEAQVRGWAALHDELTRVDPMTAARLAPADAQRIQRALEVYRLSGRPLSALQLGGRDQSVPQGTPLHIVSLEPADRGWLHRRIEERLDRMFDAGLADEVRRLRSDPRIDARLPALRAVGYRQCWEALEAGPDSREAANLRDRCMAATRQLAKRQLTWLRSMHARHPVSADAPEALQQVLNRAISHWGSPRSPAPP